VDEEAFNQSTRKYLKKLGVTTQREIEAAVRQQLESGALQGDEELDIRATVTVQGVPQEITIPGTIKLT